MTGLKPTFQNLVFPDVSYGYVTRFFLGVPSEKNEIGENEYFLPYRRLLGVAISLGWWYIKAAFSTTDNLRAAP